MIVGVLVIVGVFVTVAVAVGVGVPPPFQSLEQMSGQVKFTPPAPPPMTRKVKQTAMEAELAAAHRWVRR